MICHQLPVVKVASAAPVLFDGGGIMYVFTYTLLILSVVLILGKKAIKRETERIIKENKD